MAAPQPIPRITGWKKWRGCKNKVLQFHSREKAEAHRVKLPYGGELRSYHCGFCGNWHLGHPRPNLTEERRLHNGTTAS